MLPSLLSRILVAASAGQSAPKPALFSANSFIAAMLAIYVAFRLGLQRPFWAMLTVYLTTRPFTGAARARAVYGFIGTLLGAYAALRLVPVLVDQPVLSSVAVTAWAALCLNISLEDRTPRSYVFMRAGYTATTVAFPGVGAPEMVLDTALSRVEEILCGICCATVVHTPFFPSDVTSTMARLVRAVVDEIFAQTTDVLLAGASRRPDLGRWKLAADITQSEVLSTHLRYDTAAMRPERRIIRAMRDHLAGGVFVLNFAPACVCALTTCFVASPAMLKFTVRDVRSCVWHPALFDFAIFVTLIDIPTRS